MMAHQYAIDQANITKLPERLMGFSVNSLMKLSRLLKPGTSITVTHNCIAAQIGREDFILHTNSYELEADLEALQRISERRVAR